MKKIILITIISSLNLLISFGQSLPGNKPELLIGKTVKPMVMEEERQYMHYQNFYLEFDKEERELPFMRGKKPFSDNGFMSDYTKLVGKEFKVVAVYEIAQNRQEDSKAYAIELVNDEIGTLFYRYDLSGRNRYELEVVGGLDYAEGLFCDEIDYEKDKFDDIERSYTPIISGINYLKTIEKGKTTIYMTVRRIHKDLILNGKGLYLLFDDGSKISKPNEDIDFDIVSNGHLYKAFFELSKNEIRLLTEKTLTDTRLIAFDSTIPKDSDAILKEYLKCLVK